MITTITLGPLLDPLTFEERRSVQRFLMIGIEKGGEVEIWQDHEVGCVFAVARIPSPTPAEATS